MYGLAPDAVAVALSVVMAACYAALLLTLAVITFTRRDFE
jgi:hypothetical protein